MTCEYQKGMRFGHVNVLPPTLTILKACSRPYSCCRRVFSERIQPGPLELSELAKLDGYCMRVRDQLRNSGLKPIGVFAAFRVTATCHKGYRQQSDKWQVLHHFAHPSSREGSATDIAHSV